MNCISNIPHSAFRLPTLPTLMDISQNEKVKLYFGIVRRGTSDSRQQAEAGDIVCFDEGGALTLPIGRGRQNVVRICTSQRLNRRKWSPVVRGKCEGELAELRSLGANSIVPTMQRGLQAIE